MDIWEANKLILFIAFVVPGFVSLKCYEAFCLKPQRDASTQLIDAITYSCVNYAILFLPIYLIESSGTRTTHPKLYVFFYTFVILIAPILWALLFKFARSQKFLQKILPHPISKPWDYVFSQRREYWVLVTLNNGRHYAGYYGAKSFSSSAPSTDQIYLEQCWKINDKNAFDKVRENSAGILIASSEIEAIEFFNVHYERKSP